MIISSVENIEWKVTGSVTKILIQDEQLLKNLQNKISLNVDKELSYKTNVKGRMTHWNFFSRDEDFKNLLDQFLKIARRSNIWLEYFNREKNLYFFNISNAWGNILNKNESVTRHHHLGTDYASVLYFDDRSVLCTDAGNFKSQRGLVITMPSYLHHWVEKLTEDTQRYTLAWNWTFAKNWENIESEIL